MTPGNFVEGDNNIQELLQHGPGGGSGFDDVQQGYRLATVGFAENVDQTGACRGSVAKNFFEDIKITDNPKYKRAVIGFNSYNTNNLT